MTINKLTSTDENITTLEIEGRFDFSLHQSFRDSYIDCQKPNMTYILNLAKTTYMDSSALGMILLLKEHAEKSSGTVEIQSVNESVNAVLKIAQFHKLLKIS